MLALENDNLASLIDKIAIFNISRYIFNEHFSRLFFSLLTIQVRGTYRV